MSDILGKYKFIRKLGKGTYGQVLLVENQNGEQLALKAISKKNLQEASIVNLEGEITCMTQMKSRYIMRMYGVEQDANYKYLVCEYCNGGDLYNYQAKQPKRVFSLHEATQILVDVIYGLEQLHSSGYLHRDIKSQNIIIKKEQDGVNEYKLADFGFAKKEDLIGGTVLGSEPFMSPEIYSEQPYGFEVDMWAFGVIFYFMLNMEYPFKLNPHLMIEKRTQILRKMAQNFNYEEYVKNSKNKIQENCTKEVIDLFGKIFTANPNKRITFSQIREHPIFRMHFPEGAGKSTTLYNNKVKQFKSTIGKGRGSGICNSINVEKKRGSPERLYLEAESDKLLFLVDSQKELNTCDPLSVTQRQSLNYNLTKYFIVLYRNFLQQLNHECLKKQAPGLNWNDFCKKIQFKKLVNRYKSHLCEAQLKLSTSYDTCSNCLKQISQINPKFENAFNEKVVQTELSSDFKDSYRGSTGAAYKTISKCARQNSEVKYFLVIITMCHAFNHILAEKKQDLIEIFTSQASGYQVEGDLNFEHFREWLSLATTKKLDTMIKILYKRYFC